MKTETDLKLENFIYMHMHFLGYKKKETADNESLEQYVIIIKVSFNFKKRNYGTVEKTLYKETLKSALHHQYK